MATTTNLALNQPAYNSSAWDVPLNANETILDAAFGNTTSVSLTSSNVTLTSSQCQAMQIKFTGAISANIIVTVPAIGGRWTFTNATSGSYNVTIASAGGGTSIVIPQGYSTLLFSDGTNIVYADNGVTQNLTFSTLTVSGTATFNGTSTFNSTANFAGTMASTKNAYSNISTLTDAATITPNFANANNFTVTLGGNRTLANPTGLTAGQSGVIYVVQDATGGRTLAFGSYWKFPAAAAPTLSTAANAVDAIFYIVQSSTVITANYALSFG